MKVILVNGSPHEKGCTYTALKEIENTLNNQDIETEIFWLGNKPISGCLGCGSCLKTGKCFINDKVNEFLDKVEEAIYLKINHQLELCHAEEVERHQHLIC